MSSATPERTGSETAAMETKRTSPLRPFGVGDGPVGAARAEGDATEDSGPSRVRHVVDRFDGAVGLMVLRLVTAAVFIIRGLQKLQHLDLTRQQFGQIGIPNPDTMAVVVGVCEILIALALVFGLAVRAAGLGIAIIAIGALAYVRWRSGSIFTSGAAGFSGELELLLAGVGIALIGLGGGGWGFDRRFRRH